PHHTGVGKRLFQDEAASGGRVHHAKHQIQIAVADLPAEQLGVGRKETGKFAADVLHRFLFRQRMVCGRHGTPPFLLNRLSPWSISTKKDLSLLAGRTPGCKQAAPPEEIPPGRPSFEEIRDQATRRRRARIPAPARRSSPPISMVWGWEVAVLGSFPPPCPPLLFGISPDLPSSLEASPSSGLVWSSGLF